MTRRLLLVLLLTVGLFGGCGRADTGTDVRIRNTSSRDLVVREVSVGAGGRDVVTTLRPGEERVTLWQFAPGSVVTLKAEESPGELVYCHQFSFDEVEQAQGHLEVHPGTLDCK